MASGFTIWVRNLMHDCFTSDSCKYTEICFLKWSKCAMFYRWTWTTSSSEPQVRMYHNDMLFFADKVPTSGPLQSKRGIDIRIVSLEPDRQPTSTRHHPTGNIRCQRTGSRRNRAAHTPLRRGWRPRSSRKVRCTGWLPQQLCSCGHPHQQDCTDQVGEFPELPFSDRSHRLLCSRMICTTGAGSRRTCTAPESLRPELRCCGR